MINILLATGNESIDKGLLERFKNNKQIRLSPNAIYFREGLSDSIERFNPDIVIISDFLDGSSLSREKTIQIIRSRHPKTRIIYLMKDGKDLELRRFLFTFGIYDVLNLTPRLDIRELREVITNKREWSDIAHFFSDLDPSKEFELDDKLFKGLSNPKAKYEDFDVKVKSNAGDLFNQLISFWSVRDQSGTTTLAVNTALMLAQNKNERILIVDFNLTNPNIHIQNTLDDPDGNHNLSALSEDIDRKVISKISEVKKYILHHNARENIHILPGFILNEPVPNETVLIKTLEALLAFTKAVGYSTVIFDLEAGLKNSITTEALRKSDKIILPFIERPGTIISLQKFFNTEFGPFFDSKINMNKFFPVLNQSSHSENTVRIEQLIGNILQRKIYAKIPRSDEIFNHVLNGLPVLMREPENELILKEFAKVANCINNSFVIPSLNTSRKNFFGFKR